MPKKEKCKRKSRKNYKGIDNKILFIGGAIVLLIIFFVYMQPLKEGELCTGKEDECDDGLMCYNTCTFDSNDDILCSLPKKCINPLKSILDRDGVDNYCCNAHIDGIDGKQYDYYYWDRELTTYDDPTICYEDYILDDGGSHYISSHVSNIYCSEWITKALCEHAGGTLTDYYDQCICDSNSDCPAGFTCVKPSEGVALHPMCSKTFPLMI